MWIGRDCTPPTNTYFSFDLDKSQRLVVKNYMITKLLDSQSFLKVWKSAVQQTFCAIVRIRILCSSVEKIFAYPRNFTANFEKIYIGYLELRLKTCDNVKSVIVWNVSFCLASCSFKNMGPNNSAIFNLSTPVFWRSSNLENCNTYVTLINMKHSRKQNTNWI